MTFGRCWAVVPAAGSGRRIGADTPKQYLELNGKAMLQWTLEALLSHPRIEGVVIVLAGDDAYWHTLTLTTDKPVVTVTGGQEREASVNNGLQALLGQGLTKQDWAMVHDAARPCLRHTDIDRLIDACRQHPDGALLAMPVRDTMKRADNEGRSGQTVERDGLWHALTPQMFRIGPLLHALKKAADQGLAVTDEASAMEHTGMYPLLVEGRSDNIKITRSEDLALAAHYLNNAR